MASATSMYLHKVPVCIMRVCPIEDKSLEDVPLSFAPIDRI